ENLSSVAEQPLPIRGSLSLLAPLGEATSVPWGAAPSEASPGTLTITPKFRASEAKPLDVILRVGSSTEGSEPLRTMVLETRDQEPVLVRLNDGASAEPIAWIVTPYMMSGQEGMKRLYECKLEAARHAQR